MREAQPQIGRSQTQRCGRKTRRGQTRARTGQGRVGSDPSPIAGGRESPACWPCSKPASAKCSTAADRGLRGHQAGRPRCPAKTATGTSEIEAGRLSRKEAGDRHRGRQGAGHAARGRHGRRLSRGRERHARRHGAGRRATGPGQGRRDYPGDRRRHHRGLGGNDRRPAKSPERSRGNKSKPMPGQGGQPSEPPLVDPIGRDQNDPVHANVGEQADQTLC